MNASMVRKRIVVWVLILLATAAVLPAAMVEAGGTWVSTGSFTPREGGTLTVLPAEQGGVHTRVLSVGGYNNNPVSWSRIYNPVTGSWTSTTNNFHNPRHRHTATLVTIGDGTQRVVVVGGTGLNGALQTAELFNLTTMSWNTSGGVLSTLYKHEAHAAALLSNGKVLIVAGGGASNGESELYDPGSGTDGSFSTAARLPDIRANHTAITLADGTVLVAGGCCGSNNKAAYLYDPADDSWTRTTNDLTFLHDGGKAVRLNNGKVLFVG